MRVSALFNEIRSSADLEPFMEPVQYPEYPTYLVHVAYPIHISLILERFNNGFYRCAEVIFMANF
jgi:hypothetical protein